MSDAREKQSLHLFVILLILSGYACETGTP
jgi:hypothetical protein